MRDTIFAMATPPGRSGVAVLRISGPDAAKAASRIAGPMPPPRRAELRRLVGDDGTVIDEALVLYFPAPHSFTGEDVVELQCHGSRAVIRTLSDTLSSSAGLRLADAGEFTRRALTAGKMSITEIEGLGDLLDAETERQRRQSFSLFDGAVADRVASWRRSIMDAMVICETVIDFGEEDIPDDLIDRLSVILAELKKELGRALDEARAGQGIREGFDIAIVGLPNSGKSSLINYLAGRELAIVSDQEGTTRDVLELRYDLGGFLVNFLDTAGLRESTDRVEQVGVARAAVRARSAAMRIFLSDPADVPQVAYEDGDLVRKAFSDVQPGDFSSVTGAGLGKLTDDILERLKTETERANAFSRERHRYHLQDAFEAIGMATANLAPDRFDLVGEDIRQVAQSLDELVGRIGTEEMLGELFSSFCIGK